MTTKTEEKPLKKVCIICAKGSIEDVYATLVMANGAVMEGIDLTDKHFEVIQFIRDKYQVGEVLTIRKVGKSGIVDIKELYKLFPGGPLKKSSRIAGIPKPTSCV